MSKLARVLLIFLVLLSASVAMAKPKDGLSEPQQREAREVARRTSLDERDIKRYIRMGLEKEEIYACYTVLQFVDKDMDDIVQVYLDEDRDIDLLLKDFDISREAFDEKYAALFESEGDNPVRRANVPWLQAPYKL